MLLESDSNKYTHTQAAYTYTFYTGACLFFFNKDAFFLYVLFSIMPLITQHSCVNPFKSIWTAIIQPF
jgi:hypothetical protein